MYLLGSCNFISNFVIIFGISKKYKELFGVFWNIWYIINVKYLNGKFIFSCFLGIIRKYIIIVEFNFYIMYLYKCELKLNCFVKYEGVDGWCC